MLPDIKVLMDGVELVTLDWQMSFDGFTKSVVVRAEMPNVANLPFTPPQQKPLQQVADELDQIIDLSQLC